MSLLDLLWAPPILFAISLALGTAGRREPREIFRHVRSSFVALALGLVLVGVGIRLIVSLLV